MRMKAKHEEVRKTRGREEMNLDEFQQL